VTNIQYAQFQTNIARTFSAKDYTLIFFDASNAGLYQSQMPEGCVFKPQTWENSIGWQLGFHSSPIYILNNNFSNVLLHTLYSTANNITMSDANAYTYDPSSKIITLTGDQSVDAYLYKNLYILLDDGATNYPSNGIIPAESVAEKPTLSASLKAQTIQANGITIVNPNISMTKNQYISQMAQITTLDTMAAAAASSPSNKNKTINFPNLFAINPLKKVSAGDIIVETGGHLGNYHRTYNGTTTIRKFTVQLVTDKSDLLDLNGADWSFTLFCTSLQSNEGIDANPNTVK
jgi:hypothetical protein